MDYSRMSLDALDRHLDVLFARIDRDRAFIEKASPGTLRRLHRRRLGRLQDEVGKICSVIRRKRTQA